MSLPFKVSLIWLLAFYVSIGLGWLIIKKLLPEEVSPEIFQSFELQFLFRFFLWPVSFIRTVDNATEWAFDREWQIKLPLVKLVTLSGFLVLVAHSNLWEYFVKTFYYEGFVDFLMEFTLLVSFFVLVICYLFADFGKSILKKIA